MRTGIFLISSLVASGVCHAEKPLRAPSCALEAPLIKIAENTKTPVPDAPHLVLAEPVLPSPGPKSDALSGMLASAPVDVDQIPVLKHIAETGAALTELLPAHGLRTVVARQGEEFMFFQIAPDGEAAVSGIQSDLRVSELLTIAGRQVTEMGSAHGLRGLFVRNGAEFQVLYVTPDGERVIPGVMWDATGKNITREQVAPIAGAVPTVVVGKEGASAPAAARRSDLDLVTETTSGALGSVAAPRLWVFIDPLCSFSVRAMQELKSFVAKGQVQLAVIPVSVLDYEDQGQSTPSALAMLSKPADQMVTAWQFGDLKGPGAAEAPARLRANMAVAEAIGLRGTPTVVWRKADGSEGRIDGIPGDWNAVIASIGGEHHADLGK